MLAEERIDPSAIVGTGEGGRITREDVLAAVRARGARTGVVERAQQVVQAIAAVGLGLHEEGVRLFTAVLADTEPGSRAAADLLLSIGHSHKTLGQRPEAIEAYHKG